MPENDDNNRREEFEIIEKIKVLNVKKGDVLILRYKSEPPTPMPRDVWMKLISGQIKEIKKFVETNWNGRIGMISVPDILDLEVIRLEEWYV